MKKKIKKRELLGCPKCGTTQLLPVETVKRKICIDCHITLPYFEPISYNLKRIHGLF